MALIFCEGFEDARSVGGNTVSQLPDIWEFVAGSGYNFAGNNNGRSGYSAARLATTSSPTTTKLKLKLDAFGAQSGKTLYVGFGVRYLQSTPGTQGTTLPNRLLTFFNTAGDEVLQVSVKKEAANDIDMRLVIGQTGTVFAEYALTDLTFAASQQNSTPYIYHDSWIYLEFKIDLVDNEVTLRANGIPKFVVSTSSAEATYSTPVSDIFAIQFHGSLDNSDNVDVLIDDFYLADDSGSALNSWIGPCRVLTPNFNSASFPTNELWDPSKSVSSTLGTNDGDSGFLSSGTVGKRQIIGLATSTLNIGTIDPNADEYIAAVQLNTVLRKTNLDGAIKPIYKSATDTYHDLGAPVSIDTAFTNYKTQIFVADKNPATAENWNTAEVAKSTSSNVIGFGLQIVAPD